jgi:hypothetical protein
MRAGGKKADNSNSAAATCAATPAAPPPRPAAPCPCRAPGARAGGAPLRVRLLLLLQYDGLDLCKIAHVRAGAGTRGCECERHLLAHPAVGAAATGEGLWWGAGVGCGAGSGARCGVW